MPSDLTEPMQVRLSPDLRHFLVKEAAQRQYANPEGGRVSFQTLIREAVEMLQVVSEEAARLQLANPDAKPVPAQALFRNAIEMLQIANRGLLGDFAEKAQPEASPPVA